MNRQRRRILGYLAVFATVLLGYTLLYMWGMATFEGEPRGFFQSLEVVVETFTTTGFGADAPWESVQMTVLVILMQFTGVVLIFTTLPVFVLPAIESALEANVPTRAEDMHDHVIVCEYTSRGETLVKELESKGVEYVVIESDRETVLELREEGLSAIHGDPESAETLENANLREATTVVADSTDETNASIVLSVRELDDEIRTISFVEDPDLAQYLHYAGADQVFAPRHLVARGLANKVTTSVTARLGETVEIGTDFEIVELSVQKGSEICDTPIAESGIRQRTGASIIGAWLHGEFVASPPPDTVLNEDTVLLVAGQESQLERLQRMALSDQRRRQHGRNNVLVAGYGEVGSTVSEVLMDQNIDHTVLDIESKEGVTVVGDVTDEEVLRDAGIEDANAVILALGDDTMTMFAALIVRELRPHIEIVARANEAENVGKMYRAGVDYVLAVETISGRMLAATILGEDVMALDRQVEIVRTVAPEFTGMTLADADIRSRTGCTVIAIERDSEIYTDLDADFTIRNGDRLVVAGVDENVSQFRDIAEPLRS